ncbi:hypothetical protein [Pseudooceanicola sp. LIPI14-2-Ac024]|uniref:hypothetical protein n=1 Tax=Pseudooceanicola sp. LIPI14-2-Ac024 TaxID=3344875 RepID=UPI0035D05F3D
MTDLDGIAGDYGGTGTWHQSDGGHGGYAVSLALSRAAGGWHLAYTHVFDNGDPDTTAAFDLARIAAGPLLAVSAGGQQIGRGYAFGGALHYTLELPGNIVEATLLADGAGLRVIGSASRNKAGLAIAWEERLTRA